MAWTLTMSDDSDPHNHFAVVEQLRHNFWAVRYYRGADLIADGTISTPAPHHLPPTATLMGELENYRRIADRT